MPIFLKNDICCAFIENATFLFRSEAADSSGINLKHFNCLSLFKYYSEKSALLLEGCMGE